MAEEAKKTKVQKPRAPTLYFIIACKLVKGVLALALAFGIFKLAKQDLPELFNRFLEWLKIDPENKFLSEFSDRLSEITAANVRWVALGTFLYSLFSLVEGIGLIYRVRWAGWLAIGESAFFIPIEIHELVHHPRWYFLGLLAFNVLIVWYLFANRERLFRHHH